MARLGVVYAPKALKDIDEIFVRSNDEWGQRRTLVYAEALEEAVSRLRDYPAIGHLMSGLRKGQKVYNFGAHRIVYRVQADDLVVIRVLHQRMNLRKHL